MTLNELNFKMINLKEDTKVLWDSKNELYAYLPFFPNKLKKICTKYAYGYIKDDAEIIYELDQEEWNNLICITS